MGKPRTFYTGPVRAIGDARLAGLDHRVLHCVSLHDGMSLVKGTGRGCYATFATLTGLLGCDAGNLSRSLKRLVDWGYLTEERQDDRRRKTYRVVFDAETPGNVTPDSWQNDQQSPSEIVGNGESGNGRNPPQTEQHYSSLKGLDPLERDKLNSSEAARFAARGLPNLEFADNVGAQLAKLERALKAGEKIDCLATYAWLETVEEDEHRHWAMRICELVIDAMDDNEYRAWGEQHGWVDDEGKWHAQHPREDDGAAAMVTADQLAELRQSIGRVGRA